MKLLFLINIWYIKTKNNNITSSENYRYSDLNRIY